MLQIVASLCFLAAIVAYFVAGLDRRKPDAAPPKNPAGTRIYYGGVAGGGDTATQIFIQDSTVLIPYP